MATATLPALPPPPLLKKPSTEYLQRRKTANLRKFAARGSSGSSSSNSTPAPAPSWRPLHPSGLFISHAPHGWSKPPFVSWAAAKATMPPAAQPLDTTSKKGGGSDDTTLVGPWKLPGADSYRFPFEQGPAPIIYGPLTIGCGKISVAPMEGISYPVVHLETFSPARPIKDQDVIDLTCFLTNTIASGEHFVFYHDLRHLWPQITRVQIGTLYNFVKTNKKKMEVQLAATAIVVSNPVIRGIVNFLIWVFRPSQPTKFFKEADDAVAFLRHNFPVVGAQE